MTRLFWVGILLVVLAAPVFADVPDPLYSEHNWILPKSATCIWVCPIGDASGLDVIVRSQFNLPMENVAVVLTFADTRVRVFAPITDTTDASGFAHLVIKAGSNSTAAKAAINSGYTISANGVPLETSTVYVVSPDLDGADTVGPLDFAVFALDYTQAMAIPPGLRSDYNQDGSCTALDFAQFALHYGHTFP